MSLKLFISNLRKLRGRDVSEDGVDAVDDGGTASDSENENESGPQQKLLEDIVKRCTYFLSVQVNSAQVCTVCSTEYIM